MILTYIAAPFKEAENAKKLRDALARLGIGCTSRWLHEEVQTGGNDPSDTLSIRFARMDRYDVRRSQVVTLWNPQEYKDKGSGGRHVECGMGFSLSDMPVVIVGVKSNIFSFLPEAVLVPGVETPVKPAPALWGEADWDALALLVAREIRERCVDYGPTWDAPEEIKQKEMAS